MTNCRISGKAHYRETASDDETKKPKAPQYSFAKLTASQL